MFSFRSSETIRVRTPEGFHVLRLSVGAIFLGLVTGCSLVAPCGTDELQYRVVPTSQAIAVGESFTPSAEFRGCQGRKPLDDVITWSATDTTVVRVDAVSGRVTGRAAGVAAVQARGAKYGPMPPLTVTVQ